MIDVPSDLLAFLKDEEARAEDSDTDSRRQIALDSTMASRSATRRRAAASSSPAMSPRSSIT
jgi:hypothetical protein